MDAKFYSAGPPTGCHSRAVGIRSLPQGLSSLTAAALGWLFPATPLVAQVRINEVMASTNPYLTMADAQGRLRPGTGTFWADPEFDASAWRTGTSPLGFGGAAGLGTNVDTMMRGRTPNLYLRRTLTLSAADIANEGQLILKVRFDDGFIAWINGREVARANAGPPGQYIHADQRAYNFAASLANSTHYPYAQTGTAPSAPTTGITFPLGRVGDFLDAGDNVLAIQLLNRDTELSARIDAQLEVIPADATFDLVRHSFDDANNSAEVHRSLAGTVTDTTEGAIPANSWLALAAPAQSGSGWTDLALRSSLPAGVGYEATGALRYAYSQTDAANSPASVSGPAVPLGSRIAPGSLTQADLANLNLTFRFRATANTAYNIRLDPDGNSPANSLTGLAELTPTAGTGVVQAAADEFSDSTGARRTRIVSGTGTASTSNNGQMKNILELVSGPALRSATLAVTEISAAGSGTGTTPGALQFEVVSAPVTPDFFGFTYQPIAISSWTPAAVTPAQLKSGAIKFDYHLPAGVSYKVFLEAASTLAKAADRLGLGTITGNGAWNTATLDTGSGTNQTDFLSFLNDGPAFTVRVVFLCDQTLPSGSRLLVDNMGYFPWRTYHAALSTGSNQSAFLTAINDQSIPGFVPVLEKTGTAVAPLAAEVTIDDLTVTLTKPQAGVPMVLFPYASAGWSYLPGYSEPSGGLVEPAIPVTAGAPTSFADWIEIVNDGPAPADLSDWTLTDRPENAARYRFPAGTTLGAGEAKVILADGQTALTGAVWPHAPFQLPDSGGTLLLSDATGTIVDALTAGYPEQNTFHSWGRDPVTGAWGYLRNATPGVPNAGPWQAAQAVPPEFSVAGGFHAASVSLSLGTTTPGGTIRYTTDASEPTATTGLPYSSPLTLGFLTDRTGHVIRARTFGPGILPSDTVTHTYLINQHTGLRNAPAILLSGEAGKTFYKPEGLLAISGGTYDIGVWKPSGMQDYNVPLGDARTLESAAFNRPQERPVFLEYVFPDNRPGLREPAGLDHYAYFYYRSRYVLNAPNQKTPWDAASNQKPSFSLRFRSDYGRSAADYPMIPESPVRNFREIILGAGENDMNPFVRDELTRRLLADMGQVSSKGSVAGLYLNGLYKGYYNLVQPLREPFFQAIHQSTTRWDVNREGNFEDGDSVHWNSMLQPRLNANLTLPANWNALKQVLDVTNVADYMLLNIWAATWSWPQANWVMARERSVSGLWRCYVWDANGAFGFGGNGTSTHMLRDYLLSTTNANDLTPLPVMFRRLMTSPEFRLLFADRIQKHLFDDGALTAARMTPRAAGTYAEVSQMLILNSLSTNTAWFTNWNSTTSSGRRYYLFPGTAGAGHFRDPTGLGTNASTLWPVTAPPQSTSSVEVLTGGHTVTLSSNNPLSATTYYTLDGSDPRQPGGALSPQALIYTAPLLLSKTSVVLNARVRSVSGEWSPLHEAHFPRAAVPATAANTVIGEIMYYPPALSAAESAAGFMDRQEFEYLVIRNIGNVPINLSGLRFRQGISFDFASSTRSTLNPWERLVIAKNASALRFRYGAGIEPLLAGEYTGDLSDNGETVSLEVTADATPVKGFTYSHLPPWPGAAGGHGSSLVLIQPGMNPDPDLAASWIASAIFPGNPEGEPLNPTYDEWAEWNFSIGEKADASRTAAQGDFDGDGLPNLIELLVGANVRIQETPPKIYSELMTGLGPYRTLRMIFPRVTRFTRYKLEVQSSVNLVNWQADFTYVNFQDLGNGIIVQQWDKSVNGPRYHMRLRAVPVP